MSSAITVQEARQLAYKFLGYFDKDGKAFPGAQSLPVRSSKVIHWVIKNTRILNKFVEEQTEVDKKIEQSIPPDAEGREALVREAKASLEQAPAGIEVFRLKLTDDLFPDVMLVFPTPEQLEYAITVLGILEEPDSWAELVAN